MASVTLRTKPIQKKGYSLFLDIYNEGQRHKEYLKLYVTKDYTRPENKNILKEDKGNWELAKAIHAKRLLQVKETVAGFVPKSYQKDFIIYFKEKASISNNPNYNHALRHLLIFTKNSKLFFRSIDDIFLRSFIKYFKSNNHKIISVHFSDSIKYGCY